ncbi:MAG: glycoside hydrolase family 66 protein, partial [Chthoniobacterales bacterium]
ECLHREVDFRFGVPCFPNKMRTDQSLIGFALACMLLPFPAEQAGAQGKLRGEYGFLSSKVMGPQKENEIRARVDIMARKYGIREFMFYDWCADYSHPLAGEQWTDPFFHRHPISRHTIQISIDEIHRQGGRAWAYVQAIGAEERNLQDPSAIFGNCAMAKGIGTRRV